MPQTKEEFYTKLHQQLGKKFGLSAYAVECLRSAMLGRNWELREFTDHLEVLASRPRYSSQPKLKRRGTRRRSREFYQSVRKILLSLPDSSIAELLARTEYDQKT